MRHTRGHTRNRRSHHALEEPRLAVCPECGARHVRHRACAACGTYRGRSVLDVEAQRARRERRREKKLKEMGEDPGARAKEREEERSMKEPLSAEELSKKE